MADMGTGGQTLKSGNSPGTHEAGHCPHSRWEAQGYTANIWGARLLSKAQLCPTPTATSQWPYGVSLAYCQMKTPRLGNVKAAASTYPVSNGDEGPGVQVPGRAAGRKQPCEPQREPHPAREEQIRPAQGPEASPVPERRHSSRHLTQGTEHLLRQAQDACLSHL